MLDNKALCYNTRPAQLKTLKEPQQPNISFAVRRPRLFLIAHAKFFLEINVFEGYFFNFIHNFCSNRSLLLLFKGDDFFYENPILCTILIEKKLTK